MRSASSGPRPLSLGDRTRASSSPGASCLRLRAGFRSRNGGLRSRRKSPSDIARWSMPPSARLKRCTWRRRSSFTVATTSSSLISAIRVSSSGKGAYRAHSPAHAACLNSGSIPRARITSRPSLRTNASCSSVPAACVRRWRRKQHSGWDLSRSSTSPAVSLLGRKPAARSRPRQPDRRRNAASIRAPDRSDQDNSFARPSRAAEACAITKWGERWR